MNNKENDINKDILPVNKPFIFNDIDMDKFNKDSADGKEIYRRRLEKRIINNKNKGVIHRK